MYIITAGSANIRALSRFVTAGGMTVMHSRARPYMAEMDFFCLWLVTTPVTGTCKKKLFA